MLSKPVACPKPSVSRSQQKGRKARHEAKVKRSVRAACVERDGWCRVRVEFYRYNTYVGSAIACAGPSEWAHLSGHRRSQTRGQAPEQRHTTKHSLMLCRKHHAMEERGELKITYLSARGCDGPLKFTL